MMNYIQAIEGQDISAQTIPPFGDQITERPIAKTVPRASDPGSDDLQAVDFYAGRMAMGFRRKVWPAFERQVMDRGCPFILIQPAVSEMFRIKYTSKSALL